MVFTYSLVGPLSLAYLHFCTSLAWEKTKVAPVTLQLSGSSPNAAPYMSAFELEHPSAMQRGGFPPSAHPPFGHSSYMS